MISNAFPRPLLLAMAVVLIVLPLSADAYLDPGSGSYFFQILIGLFLTAAVSLRLMWSRVVESIKVMCAHILRNDKKTHR